MYRVAVVGDQESIYGFTVLGMEAVEAQSAQEAKAILERLIEEQFEIIYVIEALYEQLQGMMMEEQLLPAIIPIPGVLGNTGCGMARVKRSVERAVGSDILFNHENQ